MEVIFDSNVHTLYAVTAFVSAAIVIAIALSSIQKQQRNKTNHMMIFIWVIFFCFQDGIWGLFASHALYNNLGLTIISYVFHFSAITSSTVWCAYFLSRVKSQIRHPWHYLGASILLTLVQYGMLIGNIFTQFMFYVDETGCYRTTDYRSIMFYIQLGEYFLIGIITLWYVFRTQKGNNRSIFFANFLANFSPIFFGLLQMVYPDAPFDSIGFSFACLIIHTFLSRDYEQQVINLQQLQEDLNHALLEAETANQAKTAFLFNMSHDIRTPMNAIVGFTNIAIKNIDDKEKVMNSLVKTRSASDLLLSLINDILEMSRIESGKTELNQAPFAIRDYPSGIESVLSELAESKDIALTFSTGDLWNETVSMDRSRVNRILLNLGSNAIKYTKEGGSVTFHLCQLPSDKPGIGIYEFTVTDNGIGMSEEFQAHMFEEFTRETNSTTSGIQGTGLGLTVTKAFVDLMNGTISCESKPQQGTKFMVVLPFTLVDSSELPSAEISKKDDLSDLLRGKTLLLVEDNEMNREIAVDLLNDIGECKVETAEDGTIAVDKLKKMGPNYYDCIFMDIQMPFMNGYEAAKAIRAMYPDSKIPIIALSANAFSEDRQNSLAAGMNDHMSKPIDVNKMKDILNRYL